MLNRIKNTYNLSDLAKRPILLKLIVATIPNIPDDEEIDASIVYEVYTGFWLKRDWDKGAVRQLISPEQRRLFMIELSNSMFKFFFLDRIKA